MAMTFLQLQDSIMGHIGDLHPSTRTKVKRWLNDSRNEVWEMLPGIYKEVTGYLTTTVSYSTGTVSIAKGDTALTGVGTTWDTTWGRRFILIDGTDPWYEFSSIDSTTTATLISAALAAASGDTYKIDTYMWPLSSDVQDLLQVVLEDDTRVRDLNIVNRTDIISEVSRPLEWDTGTPSVCWMEEKDSSGNYQLAIWPRPTSATLVRYRYEKDLTELAADSDVVGIPGGDAAVKNKAMVEAMIFAGKPQRAGFYDQQFEKSFNRLTQTVPRDRGRGWVRRDNTDAGRSAGFPINMGSNWPRSR